VGYFSVSSVSISRTNSIGSGFAGGLYAFGLRPGQPVLPENIPRGLPKSRRQFSLADAAAFWGALALMSLPWMVLA